MEFQVWEKRIVCVYWKRSQRNNKKRVGTFFLDNPFTPFSYKTRHCFSFSAVFFIQRRTVYFFLLLLFINEENKLNLKDISSVVASNANESIQCHWLYACIHLLIHQRRHKFFFWNHWQIKPSKIVRKEFVKQKWRQNDKKVLHFQCSFFFVRAELAG